MSNSGNRIDSQLIASNIITGATIYGIAGSATTGLAPVWGIVPWYQLTRSLRSRIGNLSLIADSIDVMYDNGTSIAFMYRYRNDASDDFTVFVPMILNKTTFLLTIWTAQNISGTTSGWSPLWNIGTPTYSDDGAGNIKVIRGNALPNDGEVTYNISGDSRSGYSYTRSSNNKVPLANTTPANASFVISSQTYAFTVELLYPTDPIMSWIVILDTYLQAL